MDAQPSARMEFPIKIGAYESDSIASILRLPPFFDFVDILNCIVTTTMLIFCAGIIIFSQAFLSPMKCLLLPGMPVAWGPYYNEYCFSEGHYGQYSNNMEQIDSAGYEDFYVRHYQWIPYWLLLQVILCALPKFLWTSFVLLSSKANLFVSAVLEARNIRNNSLSHDFEVQTVASFFLKAIGAKPLRDSLLFRRQTFLFYVFHKWLQVIGIILQFTTVSLITGYPSFTWAIQLLYSPLKSSALMFPSSSLCYMPNLDAELSVNASHTHAAFNVLECFATQSNMYRIIFVFLYFWMLFVLAVSFGFAVHFTVFMCSLRYRLFCCSQYLPTSVPSLRNVTENTIPALRLTVKLTYEDLTKFSHFIESVLSPDGCLAFWFVHQYAGSRICAELAFRIWRDHVLSASIFRVSKSNGPLRLYPGEVIPDYKLPIIVSPFHPTNVVD